MSNYYHNSWFFVTIFNVINIDIRIFIYRGKKMTLKFYMDGYFCSPLHLAQDDSLHKDRWRVRPRQTQWRSRPQWEWPFVLKSSWQSEHHKLLKIQSTFKKKLWLDQSILEYLSYKTILYYMIYHIMNYWGIWKNI